MFQDRTTFAKLAALDRSQAVIEFDLDGTVLDANANFLKVVGYTLDEIKGRKHAMFVDPDERGSPAYEGFWAALRRGEFQQAEYRRIGKDDREIWIQATYNPVLDRRGRPIRVVKFATDITAQKLTTLDHMGQIAAINRSQGVIHFALDGTILDANDNFLSATGYRLDEIRGRHHRMFLEADQAESQEYRDFWRHLREGRFHTASYKRIGKGGREVWIQATYNPVLDAKGRPVKVVKYCVDITAKTHARLQATRSAGETLVGVQASASAARELSNSVAEIARSAARSKSLIDEVSAQAQAGDRSTGELERAAASMNGIVQAIQTVSGQINLLAINATIEAARAGETGRGFAVVAEEVKRLADQVTQATSRISGDIQGMQAVSGLVVGCLRAIDQSLADAQGVVSAIASAVNEQAAATQDISTAIQGAAQGLEGVNQGLTALAA